MPSRRTQLIEWIDAGAIGPGQVFEALKVTGVMPDGTLWRHFLEQLMLVLGALALVCAIVFFIAYNWDVLGRLAQFGLVQLLLLAAVVSYWKLGAEKLAARVALLFASILLGAMLALYGQTYQTGADSWQLFANWAALMLPWVLISRFSVLWLLLLILLNLAISLYFQVFPGFLWLVFNSTDDLLWLLLLLNTAAWALWEAAATRFDWLKQRWAVRLIAIASGIAMTLLVLLAIFEPSTIPAFAWLVYAAWLAAVYFLYRHKIPDLFMLAGGCLSLIVCVTASFANLLLKGDQETGPLLLLALLVMAQAAIAALWLKLIHRQQSA